MLVFFFSSRRRHTRLQGDWSSDVCSSDLEPMLGRPASCDPVWKNVIAGSWLIASVCIERMTHISSAIRAVWGSSSLDRKSTRLNSSHLVISYAVFCLKKKKLPQQERLDT